MRVVGVDSCPGGWIAVEFDDRLGVLSCSFRTTFQEIIESTPDIDCIGIDIPIGLTDGPPRACDLAARAILGQRRSSVFPAPIRQVLDAPDHRTASATAREITGKGISIQAFNITAKVAEVDAVLWPDPDRRGRVIEVHPEVSFRALNDGTPMSHSKKRPEGYSERHALLTAAFHPDHIRQRAPTPVVSRDMPDGTMSSTPLLPAGPPIARLVGWPHGCPTSRTGTATGCGWRSCTESLWCV